MTTRTVLTVQLVDDRDGATVEIRHDPDDAGTETPFVVESESSGSPVTLYVSHEDLAQLRDAIGELLQRYGALDIAEPS